MAHFCRNLLLALNSKEVWAYDPASNTWEQNADLSGLPARAYLVWAGAASQKVLVAL